MAVISSKFETQKKDENWKAQSQWDSCFFVQKRDNDQAPNGIKYWMAHIALWPYPPLSLFQEREGEQN